MDTSKENSKGLLRTPATNLEFLKQLRDTHAKQTKDILKVDARTMLKMVKREDGGVKSRDEVIKAFRKIYSGKEDAE